MFALTDGMVTKSIDNGIASRKIRLMKRLKFHIYIYGFFMLSNLRLLMIELLSNESSNY